MAPKTPLTKEALAAMCVGKQRFDSAAVAHEVSSRRSNRRRQHHERKIGDVYRCNACGSWHIGRKHTMK